MGNNYEVFGFFLLSLCSFIAVLSLHAVVLILGRVVRVLTRLQLLLLLIIRGLWDLEASDGWFTNPRVCLFSWDCLLLPLNLLSSWRSGGELIIFFLVPSFLLGGGPYFLKPSESVYCLLAGLIY